MLILNLCWYFIIFSFCGWLIEVARTYIVEKRLYNKGFLSLPFCTTYGLCAVVLYLSLRFCPFSKYLFFIVSMLSLSLVLVLIGVCTNKLLGFKPWDFSGAKLSVGSYITLPYALLLGVIGVVLNYMIIPVLNTFLIHIPINISIITVISIFALMAFDCLFSLFTIFKLKKKIKELQKDSELIDNNEVTQEKLDEVRENFNALFKDNHFRRRLASAFPDLRKRTYIKLITEKMENIKEDNMKEYTTVYEDKKDMPFAFGFCFTKLFLLFVIGSFFGTLIETVWALFVEGHFEIRAGMVYGPFIPVYGGGACLLTIVLYKLYKLNDTIIFVISAFVGASFEYLASWLQETIFGTVSWDYSDTPFNINGRTSLMYALIWGFLGLVWIRYMYPFVSKMIEKIPKRAGSIISIVLVVFMAYNGFISIGATIRWTQRDEGVPAQNSFELYLDNHFPDERMKLIFPHMQVTADEENVTQSEDSDK